MTIKIEEFDLMSRLNQVAEEFQALLAAKDAEIESLNSEIQLMSEGSTGKVDELEARLEKAKEFFKAQSIEIKQLKEDNKQLQAQLEVKLPF